MCKIVLQYRSNTRVSTSLFFDKYFGSRDAKCCEILRFGGPIEIKLNDGDALNWRFTRVTISIRFSSYVHTSSYLHVAKYRQIQCVLLNKYTSSNLLDRSTPRSDQLQHFDDRALIGWILCEKLRRISGGKFALSCNFYFFLSKYRNILVGKSEGIVALSHGSIG